MKTKVFFVLMNILPEEINTEWLKSTKAGSKDRCYANNDALKCVMNMLSARKRWESFKKCCFRSPAELTGGWD